MGGAYTLQGALRTSKHPQGGTVAPLYCDILHFCTELYFFFFSFFFGSRFVDMVMTIPKGTLFPMCGMNLAFDRELIGPAMYFGLMGDGQPIGRYDHMWAGWCCKVCSPPALPVPAEDASSTGLLLLPHRSPVTRQQGGTPMAKTLEAL